MHLFGGGKQHNSDGLYQKQYYSLRANHAGGNRVLDIARDGPNKDSAIIWEGYAGDNQCFTIIKQQDRWLFKSKLGDLYLTVAGSENGAKVYLAPKNNQPNQKFLIDQKPGSKDHVILTYANKALDVLEDKK